jgi:hypothetical protein
MAWRSIWGCIGKPNWAASPVRETLFQKVVLVLGRFRAVTYIEFIPIYGILCLR